MLLVATEPEKKDPTAPRSICRAKAEAAAADCNGQVGQAAGQGVALLACAAKLRHRRWPMAAQPPACRISPPLTLTAM